MSRTMLRRFFILTASIALVSATGGCGPAKRSSPGDRPDSNRPSSAVVFVPGFEGTAIDRSDGTRLWISAHEAIFGSDSLAYPYPRSNLRSSAAARPGPVLERVTGFFGLFSLDVYGEFFDRLRRDLPPSVEIVPFAYDWRRDNIDAVRELRDVLSGLRRRGVHPITVVGHSMGGLITAYLLRYGDVDPERAVENWEGVSLVDRVVLAGVPYRGAIQMFHRMRHGETIGLNSDILDAAAFSSFPSGYQLLPLPGTPALSDSALRDRPENLFDFETWKKFGWVDAADPERRAFVSASLSRGLAFLKRLNAPAAVPAPVRLPLLTIEGFGYPSPQRALLTDGDRPTLVFGCEDEDRTELPAPPFGSLHADGDGVVTADSSDPPAVFDSAFVRTGARRRAPHATMLSDPETADQVVRFITDGQLLIGGLGRR